MVVLTESHNKNWLYQFTYFNLRNHREAADIAQLAQCLGDGYVISGKKTRCPNLHHVQMNWKFTKPVIKGFRLLV